LFSGICITRISKEVTKNERAGHSGGSQRIPTDIKEKLFMKMEKQFDDVWEALEDNPIRAQNLRLRSELLIRITEKMKSMALTQTKFANLLCITQPRVCALQQGKIDQFRLDSLVDIAHRLELQVSLSVAA
jgi:predicted XRE-type DNA-binding protein